MTRNRTKADYDTVFDGRTRRERLQDSATVGRKGAQRGVPPSASFGSVDEIVEFVEQQVRAMTAVVRLAASGNDPLRVEQEPEVCLLCQNTEEAHLHGAKLYVSGEEAF